MDQEAEKMIEVFTDFINAHAADNREDTILRREDYEPDPAWGIEDSPRVIFDNQHYFYRQQRTIQLYVNPFHDEGGPSLLTGFFSQWEGQNGDSWDLDELLLFFDTEYATIIHNGLRTDAWPEAMQQIGG